MMAVTGGQGVDATWRSITSNPTYRQNFINGVKSLMDGGAGTADDMKGFNFDWERPVTDQEWGDYTQLARELRAALNPTGTEGREVTVCDYGSTDSDWDDTALFDAKVYDQLFMMVYHINAASTNTWTNTKLQLTAQGAAQAFSKDQIAVGVGTWGDNGPSVVGLSAIVAVNPNLPYDALTFTGTIGGSTGTWDIESRKQVREKTQYAIDNNMPGMFTWDMTYDASNNLGLHRVMHHYSMVKRNTPDMNLDGKVNATDATTLANNMGIQSLPATGTATAAQFDAFYLAGNWEKGDRDGNGFVNQADADWLASRYAVLGVTLPDRLPYSGTFESFSNSKGLSGRWRAARNAQNALMETGNFTQEAANFLGWNGTGVGAAARSNRFVTVRNQSAAETAASLNGLSRSLAADLTTAIDLGQNQETYFTFLVRENTGGLSAAQLASNNRNLSLQFLDSTGADQFNLGFRGSSHQFYLENFSDTFGQDAIAGGFNSDTTYLVVGKISGNGAAANLLQASIFASGSVVANFTDPSFQWMLSAQSSVSYNPEITDVQFLSLAAANYTVSNLWIGSGASLIAPTLTSQGDFNHDGSVNSADYVTWRNSIGQSGANLAADGNGNNQIDAGDLLTWRQHFGVSVTGAASGGELSSPSVPEPASAGVILLAVFVLMQRRARR
jgi:hypothetical protein